MDISYWTKLNPNIIYEPTSKQFFNKYLAKIEINCPAGRLINSKEQNTDLALKNRIEWAKVSRRYNYGGSWMNWQTPSHRLDEAEAGQIENLKEIKRDLKDSVKFRIEEPTVQIYAVDESALKDVVNAINPEYTCRIRMVQFPINDATSTMLMEGKVLLKANSRIDYMYRVHLKDGEYPQDTKKSVLNYLTNLGDEVKMGDTTMKRLSGSYDYLWGSFIYVNDPSILTFLNIIHPNIISKIHELVKNEEINIPTLLGEPDGKNSNWNINLYL